MRNLRGHLVLATLCSVLVSGQAYSEVYDPRQVKIIEWANLVEIHASPPGALGVISAEVQKDNGRNVLELTYRYRERPKKTFRRRVLLNVDLGQNVRVFRDRDFIDYDKYLLSNHRLGGNVVEVKTKKITDRRLAAALKRKQPLEKPERYSGDDQGGKQPHARDSLKVSKYQYQSPAQSVELSGYREKKSDERPRFWKGYGDKK